MQAGAINKTPEQWLTEIGEPPEKVAEVINSFEKGAALKVCFYRADHLFLRFHGAKSSGVPRPLHGKTVDNRIDLPNYWMDGTALARSFGHASQFETWLTDAEIGRVAKNYYREIAAICHNWNDLKENELWKVELRGTETVMGLEGPVKSQPAFAATAKQPASQSRLPGGGTQVYLYPQTPFICTPVDWNKL